MQAFRPSDLQSDAIVHSATSALSRREDSPCKADYTLICTIESDEGELVSRREDSDLSLAVHKTATQPLSYAGATAIISENRVDPASKSPDAFLEIPGG